MRHGARPSRRGGLAPQGAAARRSPRCCEGALAPPPARRLRLRVSRIMRQPDARRTLSCGAVGRLPIVERRSPALNDRQLLLPPSPQMWRLPPQFPPQFPPQLPPQLASRHHTHRPDPLPESRTLKINLLCENGCHPLHTERVMSCASCHP